MGQTDYCTVTADFTVSTNTTVNLSSWFPSNNYASGKVIEIQAGGILNVDKTFVFTNCKFRCGTGARIVTDANASVSDLTFWATFCKFFTCSDVLWGGIRVNAGDRINLWTCSVTDAARAVSFPSGYAGSTNSLRYNVFDNNEYNLYIGEAIGGGATVGFTSCWGNTFEQSGTVKTTSVDWTHSGVYAVRNSVVVFGTTGGPKNTFQNMRYGIYISAGTAATITNSDFISMNNTTSDQFDGTGVFANGSTLTITQAAGTARCYFFNTDQGVFVRQAVGPTTVEHVDFELRDLDYGIKYQLPQNNTRFTFQDNTFDLLRGSYGAIYADRPPASTGIGKSLINGNHIVVAEGTANDPCFTVPLIKIQGKTGAFNTMEISDNYIENFSECRNAHGIYVQGGGDNYELSDNVVEYLGNSNRIGTTVTPEHNILGIVFTDMHGFFNKIETSEVLSRVQVADGDLDFNNNSFVKCGIHVVNCNEPFICGNTTYDTYRGFHFGDSNPQTIFGQNDMHTHVYGVEFRKSADGAPATNINDQIRRENTWSTSATDYIDGGVGARYYDAGSVPFEIIYNPVFTNHKPPSAMPAIGSWFSALTGEANECSEITIAISELDIEVAKDEYDYPNAAVHWDLQRRLWYKLIRYPDLIDDDPDVEDFYDNTTGSSAQQFATAIYEYEQAYLASSTLADDLNNIYNEYDTLVAEILILDEDINQDTTNLNSTLAGNLEDKIEELAALNDDLSSLAAGYATERDDALEDVETSLSSLPDTAAYEAAWVTILELAIKNGRGEELDSVEREGMVDIAESCHSLVGSARQEVLTFMPAEDAAPYWGREDDEGCVEERAALSTKSVVPTALTVSPNPAGRWMLITFPDRKGGVWTIFDLAGRIKLQHPAVEGQMSTKLNLIEFATGTYILQFISSKGERFITKFSVSQ